jgi:hypothetical protein
MQKTKKVFGIWCLVLSAWCLVLGGSGSGSGSTHRVSLRGYSSNERAQTPPETYWGVRYNK